MTQNSPARYTTEIPARVCRARLAARVCRLSLSPTSAILRSTFAREVMTSSAMVRVSVACRPSGSPANCWIAGLMATAVTICMMPVPMVRASANLERSWLLPVMAAASEP